MSNYPKIRMFQGLVVRQACPELAEVAHHEREKSVRPEFIEGHGNPNLNFGTGACVALLIPERCSRKAEAPASGSVVTCRNIQNTIY